MCNIKEELLELRDHIDYVIGECEKREYNDMMMRQQTEQYRQRPHTPYQKSKTPEERDKEYEKLLSEIFKKRQKGN